MKLELGSLFGAPRRLEDSPLSNVREASAARYSQALADVRCELDIRDVPWASMSEAERDLWLAECVLEFYDNEVEHTSHHAAVLLAALQKNTPRHKYKLAWRTLDSCIECLPQPCWSKPVAQPAVGP